MNPAFAAPWHRTSFERLMRERLPLLLAENLPMAGYRSESSGVTTCQVQIELDAGPNGLSLTYHDLPQPDANGLFLLDGQPYVVIPLASDEELDRASITCVGEQLEDWLRARLGRTPADLAWDESQARSLLPLNTWFAAFLREKAQRLDSTNWFSRHTHLRRILIPNRQRVIAPGQLGRVDPFETPEGPNIGRVFSVAVGAEIRAGRMVINDASPTAGLGTTSQMVPLLEYDDANRLLMGVNMLRQALPPQRFGQPAEAALLQTGCEPESEDDFWVGRNLLTAYISLGEDTTADGIVLSQSAAQRLNYPSPAVPGDKLANRHGSKGVVSRVLPDDDMPHLADGTPVELVYSFHSLHARLNFGQVLEAVLGRIARAEGQPVIAPPFASPTRDQIHARLVANDLPENGMEILLDHKAGQPLPFPSTAGWVYWLRLAQLAEDKLSTSGAEGSGQVMGELEVSVLRSLGALHNAREVTGLRSARWDSEKQDAPQAGDQQQASELFSSQPARPTPLFQQLVKRLQAAGIQAELVDSSMKFSLSAPTGEGIRLAQAMPHPWLPEAWIETAGILPDGPAQELNALRKANDRLARLSSSQAPERLLHDARRQLSERVSAYLDALLPPAVLQINEAQRYSAMGVVAPGPGLACDQLGLPESIAWTWFGARIADEVSPGAVEQRTEQATQALDRQLAGAWLLALRKPAVTTTALLAFRPVRVPGAAICLPALALDLLGADFDGDQIALFLPLSAQAQAEAGQKLSIAAHLARDPQLIRYLLPRSDAQWGLAWLSLSEVGRSAITSRLGNALAGGLFTQDSLAALIREQFERHGAQNTLQTLQALSALGYAAVARSGASLCPFAGERLACPPAPVEDDPRDWQAYQEQWVELVLSNTDFEDPQLGPQWLSAQSHPRGRASLPMLVGPRGPLQDETGAMLIIRHSVAEGRPPAELLATLNSARGGLARLSLEQDQTIHESLRPPAAEPLSLLARARRARRPGVIFARAAANHTSDPLQDEESRILIGLP